jgi:hypothetical protein
MRSVLPCAKAFLTGIIDMLALLFLLLQKITTKKDLSDLLTTG